MPPATPCGDPALPSWLDDLIIRNLRIGKQVRRTSQNGGLGNYAIMNPYQEMHYRLSGARRSGRLVSGFRLGRGHLHPIRLSGELS
jgi:hypothetical protein